jgi:uncharacterized protein
MKLLVKAFLLAVFVFFLFLPVSVQALDIPKPSGYVNDVAGVLSSQQKDDLEDKLKTYEEETGNEIAVLIIKNLEGENIDDFAVRVFENWKIGKEGKDNGILFLAAIEDRKMRIEIGYGLEPFVTDGDAGEIIREVIAPKFQSEDYFGGISEGVDKIAEEVESPISEPKDLSKIFDILGFIFGNLEFIAFIFIVAIYLLSYMARTSSFWLGGVVGLLIGVIIGAIFVSLVVGVIGAVFFGIVGLILDFLLSHNYKKLQRSGYKTDWVSTKGGFWGSSGSGVGFGGFGGGSSGGGGASGRW